MTAVRALPPLHCSFLTRFKGDVVIAIGTVLTVLLLFAAWRSGSWLVALLGIAVGASASGPVSSLINTLVDAGTSLASSLDSLL